MGLFSFKIHKLLGYVPYTFNFMKYFIQKKGKNYKIEKIEKKKSKKSLFLHLFSEFQKMEIWAFDPFSPKNYWA